MTLVQGFEVDQRILDEMKVRGESCAICRGCRQVMGAVKNCRTDYYCAECSKKVSSLKRYSNAGYKPSQAETEAIFRNMHRAA